MEETLRKTILAILACTLALALQTPQEAPAQEAIVVQNDVVRNEFPRSVTFFLSFSAPASAGEVRLRYRLAPDGTGASAIADCGGAATINCTYTLTSGRGIFVIPGAQITYHWDIADTAGNELATRERLYVHEDPRFEFETLQDGNITVYFHPGTAREAPSVLEAAAETLREIGELEQTQVTFPIKVFLYESAQEMQPAIISGGGGGVSTLGEVVYSDTAMVSADVATLDITRHEVAHIITREATRGPFELPRWMNEGISVYAQRQLLESQQDALDSAIRRDRVLSFIELSASTAGNTAGTVSLFYGQSGDIIRYLVETQGAEKFGELLRIFKEGSTPDKAFQAVYGFDEQGLEDRWRESVGLEPREQQATPLATREPTPRDGDETPASDDSSSDAEEDGGTSTLLIVVIAALAAVVLAAIAGAAALAMRRPE